MPHAQAASATVASWLRRASDTQKTTGLLMSPFLQEAFQSQAWLLRLHFPHRLRAPLGPRAAEFPCSGNRNGMIHPLSHMPSIHISYRWAQGRRDRCGHTQGTGRELHQGRGHTLLSAATQLPEST